MYLDFDAHSEEEKSFLEFNWSDHAYYILRNLYPGGVDCFNSEIEFIASLTTDSYILNFNLDWERKIDNSTLCPSGTLYLATSKK